MGGTDAAAGTLSILITSRSGPLEGLVVAELTRTLAGEIAGGLLADMGATVIKVEPPEGSPLRRRGPAIPGEDDSLYFQCENRGKLSVQVSLDPAEPSLTTLLACVDGVVEDYGPGGLERLGVDIQGLQRQERGLCVLRISPFGQSGPLAHEQGDDRIAQAFAGAQFATGWQDRHPVPVTVPIADCWTAALGAAALLMAMHYARRHQAGQVVDIALYDTLLRMQESLVVNFDPNGSVFTREGNHHPTVVPANIYPTADGGFVALSGAGDKPFARLCEAIERPELATDPRFAGASRREHRAELDEIVGGWIATHTTAEVEQHFAAMGVAAAALRSVDEIIPDEHIAARGSLIELRSPSGTTFRAPACVPRFGRTPTQAPEAAPMLGEHTGLIQSELEGLRARPRIGVTPTHSASLGGPLEGVRVLELATGLAGPSAGALLGDFGAEVLKVDLPGQAPAGPPDVAGLRLTNRHKRRIELDVRTAEGRERVLDITRTSDVLLENFRPGTLERWGLEPERLLEANPALVILRASGFGQDGPYRERSSWNPVGVAFGGVTYLNGWPDRPPLRDGLMAGDYTTALFNVLAILAGLTRRDADGEGQVVDVSMVESALRMTGDAVALRTALGVRAERAAGAWPVYPVTATAEASDGRYVTVSCDGWDELTEALASVGADAGTSGDARAAFDSYAASRRSGEVVSALRRAGLRCSVVNSVAEIHAEPHCWSRGNLVRWQHPQLGEVVTQGVTPLFSLTPGRVWASGDHEVATDAASSGRAAARPATG